MVTGEASAAGHLSKSVQRDAAVTRHHVGRQAERAAVQYLRAKGLEILECNLRLGYLEIDILAREGDQIVVVEVRTRGAGAWQSALGSIDRVKRKRLVKAATLLWQRRFASDASLRAIRFDAIAVRIAGHQLLQVEHIRAAFCAN